MGELSCTSGQEGIRRRTPPRDAVLSPWSPGTCLVLVLTLAACSQEASVQPEQATARLQLPAVGRAVRYSLDLASPVGHEFDVVEVSGTQVRLREGWCAPDAPGFVVDWREVESWEITGAARGDDRFLGLPFGEGFWYGGDD